MTKIVLPDGRSLEGSQLVARYLARLAPTSALFGANEFHATEARFVVRLSGTGLRIRIVRCHKPPRRAKQGLGVIVPRCGQHPCSDGFV